MLLRERSLFVLVFTEHIEQAGLDLTFAFFPVLGEKNRRKVFNANRTAAERHSLDFAFIFHRPIQNNPSVTLHLRAKLSRCRLIPPEKGQWQRYSAATVPAPAVRRGGKRAVFVWAVIGQINTPARSSLPGILKREKMSLYISGHFYGV